MGKVVLDLDSSNDHRVIIHRMVWVVRVRRCGGGGRATPYMRHCVLSLGKQSLPLSTTPLSQHEEMNGRGKSVWRWGHLSLGKQSLPVSTTPWSQHEEVNGRCKDVWRGVGVATGSPTHFQPGLELPHWEGDVKMRWQTAVVLARQLRRTHWGILTLARDMACH